MLKKLKTALTRWLTTSHANPSNSPEQPHEDRRIAPPRETVSSHRQEKPSSERRSKSGRRGVTDGAAAPPAPRQRERKAPQPPAPLRPESLSDVPKSEGKTRFLDLPIHESVQFGIQHMSFSYCTPIQALALPHALSHRDIAGKAQTGTGKTAAFLISAFTHLLNHPLPQGRRPGCPRALVLAPTRELAIQIHKDAQNLGVFTGLKCTVVFGGADYEQQRRALNDPIDLLVGTPGRIIDFSRGGALNLGKVEILVIDEADRMLDMGFIPDVKRIVAQLPCRERRQTMLFSATLDESILRFSSGWLVDPVKLESEPEQMVSGNIEQIFYSVSRDEKLALTLNILRTMSYDRILIFGNRKDVNQRLQEDLARYGVHAPLFSGDIPQEKRIRILEKFRSGAEKVLIATDVAARGIHVDDISIVLNYDLPERAEDYVHRIGRTGRAGNCGKAISFLCEYGAYNLPAIEALLGVTFNSIQPDESMLKLPPLAPGATRPEDDARHRRTGDRGGRQRRRRSRR